MRILQVSRMSPARQTESSQAAFSLVEAICRAGHQVTYAWFPDRRDWVDILAAHRLVEACQGNLTLLPLAGRTNWVDDPGRAVWAAAQAAVVLGLRLRQLLAPQRSHVLHAMQRLAYLMRRFDPRPVLQLERLLAANPYDVIQFDYPWTIRLASQLRLAAPSLFVAHEVQCEAFRQMFPDDRRLHESVRRRECRELKRYSAVAALSAEDADLLREQMGLGRVYCSPLPLPGRQVCAPVHTPRRGRAVSFSFLGGCRHYPNVDAVRWLVREILPRLRVAFPYLKVQIVGHWSPRHQHALGAEDVAFSGVVRRLAAALRPSIFLCPLRIGSGQRIKILDAVLCGLPVISTRAGARGLGLVENEHYLPADTPEAFVAQAVRLSRDTTLSKRLATAAQAYVLRAFAPEAMAQQRIEILREVAGLGACNEVENARRAA